MRPNRFETVNSTRQLTRQDAISFCQSESYLNLDECAKNNCLASDEELQAIAAAEGAELSVIRTQYLEDFRASISQDDLT